MFLNNKMLTNIIEETIPQSIITYVKNDIELALEEDEESEEESEKETEESVGIFNDPEFVITILGAFVMLILTYYTFYVYSYLYIYLNEFDLDSISTYVLSCSTFLNFMYYIFLKAYFILEKSSDRIKINIVNILTHCLYSVGGYYTLEQYNENNDLYTISKRYYYSHYVMIFLITIRSIYLKIK